MTGGFGDQIPGGEQPREQSPGEIEIEQGSLLLQAFRWFKVAMPEKNDAAAVERTGQLLQRKFPWIAKLTKGQSK